MVVREVYAKGMKVAAGLLAASSLATAGNEVTFANKTEEPICLRLGDGQTVAILAQDQAGPKPVELSLQAGKVTYCVQPGDTCILQFKETQGLPLKTELGLVDLAGVERGRLTLENKPLPCAVCASREESVAPSVHATKPKDHLAQDHPGMNGGYFWGGDWY